MLCVGIVLMWCALPAPQTSIPTDSFCQTYRPVMWSAADTRLTKEQVDTNNRVYKKLCR